MSHTDSEIIYIVIYTIYKYIKYTVYKYIKEIFKGKAPGTSQDFYYN